MAGNATAISPDDPQLTERLLPNPAPLFQRALDLGLDKKLTRLSNCREFSRFHACNKGHMHCERSSLCGLRCLCKDCAMWIAMKQVKKFEPLSAAIPSRFVYIVINPREPATHESLIKAEKQALKTLRRIPSKLLLKVSASTRHRPEVRILYANPIATSDLMLTIFRDAFPQADVFATVHFQEQYVQYLTKLTADPAFDHADPYRADMEDMFDRIRQIHVLGFNSVELSVCVEHTNNSTETVEETQEPSPITCTKCDDIHLVTVRTCKICGERMIHTSNWVRTADYLRARDPQSLKWKDGWEYKTA